MSGHTFCTYMKPMLGLLRFLPRSLQQRLVTSQLDLDDEPDDVVIKVASTTEEHEQASRIVHESYLHRGYIERQRAGIWVTAHGLMPWTIVFVAKQGDEVVGTMSLVLDSAARLPMDKIYGAELDALRNQGSRMAEVGALCVKKGYRRRGIRQLINKLMWQCARLLEVDRLVICVHPTAVPVYETTLFFERFGREHAYPGLRSAASTAALTTDLVTVAELLKMRFGSLPSKQNLHAYFTEKQHKQIWLPSTTELRATLSIAREPAADRLGMLRPEAFNELDTLQRRAVRSVFPKFQNELRSLPLLGAQGDEEE